MKLIGLTMAIAVAVIVVGGYRINHTGQDGLKVQVPSLNQVKSVEISNGGNGPNQPSPLTMSNPTDVSKIDELLKWLSSAKPTGIEDPHRPMPSMGPTTLIILLKNGKSILIQPAIDTVTHKYGTKIVQSGHSANGFVDFQYADSDKTVRLSSPQLDSWFTTNAWKSDFKLN